MTLNIATSYDYLAREIATHINIQDTNIIATRDELHNEHHTHDHLIILCDTEFPLLWSIDFLSQHQPRCLLIHHPLTVEQNHLTSPHLFLQRPFTYPQLIHAVAQVTTNQRDIIWNNIGHFKSTTLTLHTTTTVPTKSLTLTEREGDILQALAQSPKPLTRDHFHHTLWNHQAELETHRLETHISRLRNKLKQLFGDRLDLRHEPDGYRLIVSTTTISS